MFTPNALSTAARFAGLASLFLVLPGCVIRTVAPAEPPPVNVVTQPPPATTANPPPPSSSPRPKFKNFQMENGALKLPGPVVFETGSDKLRPESDDVLAIVKDYLDSKPEITLLRIEGHTDATGDAAANQTLSEKRAMAVARWLVAKGIACNRVLPVGFGQTRPIADNNTPDGKAQNRRTAFVNAALKGKPIGGMPVDGGGRTAGDPCR